MNLWTTISVCVTASPASCSCCYLEEFALVELRFSWEQVHCVGRTFILKLWAF